MTKQITALLSATFTLVSFFTAVACSDGIQTGANEAVQASDVCGGMAACGISTPFWAKVSDPKPIGDPFDQIGKVDVHDDKHSRTWVYISSPTCRDVKYDSSKGGTAKEWRSGTIGADEVEKTSFAVSLAGNLNAVIGNASLQAGIQRAVEEKLKENLTFKTTVYELDESTYASLKKDKSCHDPGSKKYLRRSITVLQLDGTSAKEVTTTVKGAINAAAGATGGVGAVGIDGGAAIDEEKTKKVEATIAQSSLVIRVGWDD